MPSFAEEGTGLLLKTQSDERNRSLLVTRGVHQQCARVFHLSSPAVPLPRQFIAVAFILATIIFGCDGCDQSGRAVRSRRTRQRQLQHPPNAPSLLDGIDYTLIPNQIVGAQDGKGGECVDRSGIVLGCDGDKSSDVWPRRCCPRRRGLRDRIAEEGVRLAGSSRPLALQSL